MNDKGVKMRKLHESIRFPQSIDLFRFCFRILEIRKPNEKIHDQNLGSILGFNPSDTSHWKRGKKCIKSIQAIETLSKVLEVDQEIIQDLADGSIDLDEAWSDFCDAEEERRISYEEPGVRIERRDKSLELEKIAKSILDSLNIKSIPVYIPELINAFPYIQLLTGDVADKLARSSRIKPGQYAIRYRKGDIRAHTRIAIAREIARIILLSERNRYPLSERCETLAQAEIFDFANALLVPREALALEIQKSSTRVHMVKSLAELFWVPKSVIRARLTTILLETANNEVFEAGSLAVRLYNQDANSAEESHEEFLDEEFPNELSFTKKSPQKTPNTNPVQ